MRFLKENWLWILVPFLAVVVAVVTLLLLGGGQDETAPFDYNVF